MPILCSTGVSKCRFRTEQIATTMLAAAIWGLVGMLSEDQVARLPGKPQLWQYSFATGSSIGNVILTPSFFKYFNEAHKPEYNKEYIISGVGLYIFLCLGIGPATFEGLRTLISSIEPSNSTLPSISSGDATSIGSFSLIQVATFYALRPFITTGAGLSKQITDNWNKNKTSVIIGGCASLAGNVFFFILLAANLLKNTADIIANPMNHFWEIYCLATSSLATLTGTLYDSPPTIGMLNKAKPCQHKKSRHDSTRSDLLLTGSQGQKKIQTKNKCCTYTKHGLTSLLAIWTVFSRIQAGAEFLIDPIANTDFIANATQMYPAAETAVDLSVYAGVFLICSSLILFLKQLIDNVKMPCNKGNLSIENSESPSSTGAGP